MIEIVGLKHWILQESSKWQCPQEALMVSTLAFGKVKVLLVDLDSQELKLVDLDSQGCKSRPF